MYHGAVSLHIKLASMFSVDMGTFHAVKLHFFIIFVNSFENVLNCILASLASIYNITGIPGWSFSKYLRNLFGQRG
jgi:hypothetical protein